MTDKSLNKSEIDAIAKAISAPIIAVLAEVTETIKGLKPAEPAAPRSMAELSARHWEGKGRKPAPAGDDDVSDLIPTPMTTEETWAKFHASAEAAIAASAERERRRVH